MSQEESPSSRNTSEDSALTHKMSQLALNDVQQARRRLSMANDEEGEIAALDGSITNDKAKDQQIDAIPVIRPEDNSKDDQNIAQPVAAKNTKIFNQYYSFSKVGYAPYSNAKVNQDRACEAYPFTHDRLDRAFFGVFDGHGQFGHQVSQFCAANLPKLLSRQDTLGSDKHTALRNAFESCHVALTASKVDSNYSGTTAVTVFFEEDTIYCANVGDSRCVLATINPTTGQLVAVDLSVDHKPSLEAEAARILSRGGRVETCKNDRNEPVGPLRVWLRTQDVPGLAMTRSFGDRVAACVGVQHIPEIISHTYNPKCDKFIILASDGVWEFLSSQEAVDIVAQCSSAQQACEALYKEADHRWRREEEVVDDITALVVFLNGHE